MENIIAINLFVFVSIAFIIGFKGLNLRKWSNWLIIIYGFITGFSLGFFYYDIRRGIMLGGFFTIATIFTGAIMYSYRRRYDGFAESWLSRYGQGDHPSLLVRLFKKIFKN